MRSIRKEFCHHLLVNMGKTQSKQYFMHLFCAFSQDIYIYNYYFNSLIFWMQSNQWLMSLLHDKDSLSVFSMPTAKIHTNQYNFSFSMSSCKRNTEKKSKGHWFHKGLFHRQCLSGKWCCLPTLSKKVEFSCHLALPQDAGWLNLFSLRCTSSLFEPMFKAISLHNTGGGIVTLTYPKIVSICHYKNGYLTGTHQCKHTWKL